MTEREDIEAEFATMFGLLAGMDLGVRGVLMMEIIVMCKLSVLDVLEGPEIPECDHNVPAARLAWAHRQCDKLNDELKRALRRAWRQNLSIVSAKIDDGLG